MSRPLITGLALLIAAVALLEWLVAGGVISPFLIARPSDIGRELASMLSEERLLHSFLLTFGIVLVALAIAVVVGLAFGYLLFRIKLLGRAYQGLLGALFAAPVILLYPLFLVLFGRTALMIVVMGVLVGVIPVTLKTLEGFNGVPRVLVNVAKCFNATQTEIFWKIMLPSALPVILTGVRLSLIYVMINVVAIEFLNDFGGLGYMVGEMYDRYNIPGMYAAIVAVILISVIFFNLSERIEKWLR